MPIDPSSSSTWLERLGVPAALVVGASLLFIGLGSDGLWEPWEMDRAQIARDLAGPGQVAVGLNRHDGQVRAAVEAANARVGTVARFSPQPLRKARTQATANKTIRDALDRARDRVVAAVVLDLTLTPKNQAIDYDRAWTHLDEALGHVPIGRVIALAPDGAEGVAEASIALRSAQLRARAAEGLVPLGLELSDWPEGEKVFTDTEDAANLPSRLAVVAMDDQEGLAAALEAARDDSASVARFKERGSVLTVPPLRHRLSAMLTGWMGTTETTVRLAGSLLAFLALLAVVLTLGARFGPGVAFITGIVLATTPLFFVHGRSVVGEPGSVLAMTLVAMGLLEISWASAPSRVWAWLVGGLVIGFFAKGLTMLLALFVLVTTVSAVAGDRRLANWLPAIVFGLCLAGAAAWVLSQPPDSFAGQFRFTQKLFSAGPTAYDRNFDWAIKRLGFGALPWSPFLVLAMARQVKLAVHDQDRSALVLVMWFTVPTLAALGMLKDFNVALWWGAPAGAVAIGAWLRDLWRRGQASRFEGFLLVVMSYILLRELGKSPAPLVDILAFDPPLADKAGQRFPDDVELASWIRLITLGLVGLVFVHQARLVEVAGRALGVLARPRPTTWVLSLALVLIPIIWLVRVGNKYTAAMGHTDMKALSPEQRGFPLRFVFRDLDPIMLLSLGAVGLVLGVLLWRLTRLRWRPWPIDEPEDPGRPMRDRLLRIAGLAGIGLGVHMLFSVSWPDGYWAETMVHPAMGLVALGYFGLAWGSRRLGLARWDRLYLPFGWLGLWLGTRLSRDAELVTWGALVLTGVIGVSLAGAALPRLNGSVSGWARSGSWIVFAALLAIFAPLVDRLETVEAFLYPDSVGPGTLEYLLTRSRVTWLFVGLIVVILANSRLRRSDDRDTIRALASLIEHRRVATVSAALAGVIFSVGLLVSFQPAVAFHVSQKHIMDTYRASESLGLGELGPRIFRHGTFSASGRADTNFYTAAIPEVRDRSSALKALLAARDQALSIETVDGSSMAVVPGWSGENDTNQDGQRDHEVIRGTATRIISGSLEDESAQWAVDEHKGRILVDSRGKSWTISGNDAQALKFTGAGVPSFSATRPERSVYTIDSPESAVHAATSPRRQRTYMLLPAETFSDINHAYRKLSDGAHIPVVDGRSARVLLAASWLNGEEVQQNRFALHTISKAQFDGLTDPRVHRAAANFDDTIRVLGYRIEDETVGRGKKIRLTFYFEALKDIRKSYKIFLHIDQSGNRIHGDHWPLNLKQGEAGKNCVGCYKSDHWLKGDVVLDVFETEVPAATPSGAHEIWLGFFTPGSDKRLKVKDWDRKTVRHDGHNRVRLGTLQVR